MKNSSRTQITLYLDGEQLRLIRLLSVVLSSGGAFVSMNEVIRRAIDAGLEKVPEFQEFLERIKK